MAEGDVAAEQDDAVGIAKMRGVCQRRQHMGQEDIGCARETHADRPRPVEVAVRGHRLQVADRTFNNASGVGRRKAAWNRPSLFGKIGDETREPRDFLRHGGHA